MLGDIYDWVQTTLIGEVPLEFEFIYSFTTIFIVIMILYCVFFGFIFLKDIFGGR